MIWALERKVLFMLARWVCPKLPTVLTAAQAYRQADGSIQESTTYMGVWPTHNQVFLPLLN